MKAPEEKPQTKAVGPVGAPSPTHGPHALACLPNPPLVGASKSGSVILGVIESVDLYSRG